MSGIIEIVLGIVGGTSAIGFIVSFILKILPNHVAYNFGYKLGRMATVFGNSKIPSYEKIEKLFQDTFGSLFKGIDDGLDSDEDGNKPKPKSRV